jgi:hypothetical protein
MEMALYLPLDGLTAFNIRDRDRQIKELVEELNKIRMQLRIAENVINLVIYLSAVLIKI